MTSTRHHIFLKLHFPDTVFLTFIFPTAQQPANSSVTMNVEQGPSLLQLLLKKGLWSFEDRLSRSIPTHPPSQEQCEVEEVLTRGKSKAEEHPEQPPAQLLRNELADVHAGKTVSGKEMSGKWCQENDVRKMNVRRTNVMSGGCHVRKMCSGN
ncbi:hypothetical protein V9T40_014462 [Parthenolecanium corni]|uniref:Uncharacterized protein n=1 Tax=Parthenolecanium corni TaxID=536013 RepID=A0AAN9T6X2_9HEMI